MLLSRCAPVLALAASLALAGPGCGGKSNATESGAQCTDGKDNDGDGAVDCQDADCAATFICSGRVDGGRDLRLADAPRPPDSRAPDRTSTPDQGPASSYGNSCVNMMELCPDGKTLCVPGGVSPSAGYCTYSCDYDGECPAPPAGMLTECLFNFSGEWYCAFLCMLQYQNYPCPSGFGCYDSRAAHQKFCWPD